MVASVARLHRVAGEDLRAPDEAALIKHQPQGEQHRIGALLLRVAACGFRIALERALEVGVGQVVQRHGALQSKETAHTLEEERLDSPLMTQQQVGGPIQTHQRHDLEIELDHFSQRRFVLQPAPGGQLRSRGGHAPDQVADGRRALRAIEPQGLQLFDETDLAHHRKPRVLHSHRARLELFQRVGVHLDKGSPGVRQPLRPPSPHALALTQQQLRGVVLREFLQRGIERQQPRLTGEDLLDARTKRGPVLRGDREMPPQIQQRDLAHTVRDALGAHQAVRKVEPARRLVVRANPP